MHNFVSANEQRAARGAGMDFLSNRAGRRGRGRLRTAVVLVVGEGRGDSVRKVGDLPRHQQTPTYAHTPKAEPKVVSRPVQEG